jgi:hypothetical protein
MLDQDHPTVLYISPRSYIRKTNYPDLAFHESFQAYKKQRNELLRRLGICRSRIGRARLP